MIYLILLLALGLRLVNLNQSLWLDEAVQAITARESFSYIFTEIVGDFHPPLYHFLMHFWVRAFGDSEIALRLPSVLFGVGAVYVIYKISGKLGAILLATSPFHIYYSQEARMYSMACFFAALSMYFFINLEKSKKNKYWYFLATILMLYSDYYGFLVLLAQVIYLAVKRNYKFLLICLFAYLLIYLPWLPMLFTQISTGLSATQSLPGWGRLVNVSFLKAIPLTLIKFTIGRITIFDKKLYAVVSGFIILFCGFFISKAFLKRKDYLMIFWLLIPLGISWMVSLFIPNFQPFRLLLILPAFYLLLAEGIGAISNKKIRSIVIGLFLTVNLLCLSVYFFNPYFQREDWKGTVNFLLEQKKSVILPSETSSWPIRYYDKNKKIKLLSIGSGVEELKKVDGIKDQNVFLINYLTDVFDPKGLIVGKLKDEGYNKVREINFNQINLIEYKK